MRLAKAMFCAAALFALAAQGVRADDYNKLTYLTFSAPVQVPGATLPAGTYMFKLANPESGRRAIQIWDREGKKLHTTLLTMSDERMEIPKQPMVMFSEAPSGEPPAVRSWFYEGERMGYEFVYPKDQAMKIARAAHTSVLAMLDALNSKVARIDESGQFADASVSTAQSATAAPVPASATVTAESAPQPSANRTDSAAPSARTDAATPVGTTGSATTLTPQSASAASTTSIQPAARAVAADTTPRQSAARELPRTASSLPLFELLSGVSLLSAWGVRRLRRRLAENS